MTIRRSVAVLLDCVFEYHRELLRGIESRLNQAGVSSVVLVGRELHPTDPTFQHANDVYQLLRPEDHLGVIVGAASLGHRSSDQQLQDFYQRLSGLPVVTIGRETAGCSVVQVDNRSGMTLMMQHLLSDRGFRKFVFLKGTEGNQDARDREEVFCSMLQQHGLNPAQQHMLQGEFFGPRAEEEMRKLLGVTRDFEAVVCANDEMALMVLHTLQEHGLRVPQDVVVVGFDDSPGAAYSDPPLTTVRQPLFQQGWQAADLLLDHLQGSVYPQKRILNSELVIRASSRNLTPEFSAQDPWRSMDLPADLLQGLQQAVTCKSPELFLDPFQRHLQDHPSGYEDTQALKLLSRLEAHLAADLPAKNLSMLRSVVFQTRNMLVRREHFRTARAALTPGRNPSHLHRLELSLISQTEWGSLRGDLERYLQWYHMQGIAVALYPQPGPQVDDQLRVFFTTQHENQGNASSLWEHLLKVPHLLVLPLFVRDTHLGLLLADSLQAQQVDIEHLQYLLSSGLHHIHFNQQQQKYTLELRENMDRSASEVAELSQQMEYLAVHDEVTGLANKTLFQAHLEQVIHHPQAQHDYAVLFLDVDRFKKINDTYGHRTGDLFLKTLAEKLQGILRPYDTVARFGGDEFAVLLSNVSQSHTISEVVLRLQRELGQPFEVCGHHIQTTVSVGVVTGDPRYTQVEDLLRDADIAMYEAKKKGGGQHRIFEVHMHHQVSARTILETELRQALREQTLTVHFQPIISLQEGKIEGFEALARWIHPQRGFISPAQFIPIAEESGLIVELDRLVLRQACQQVAHWQQHLPEGQKLTLNVNMSTVQFTRGDLLEGVQSVLQDTGFPAEQLNLEITESLLLERAEVVLENIRALQQLGVKLHIDDFGTGYSSLGYLQQFAASCLKIDRSFILRLLEDPKCSELVRTIIQMAHNLGMSVVAEGVEEQEQLSWLRQAGCERVQGYLLSRPLAAPQAAELLSSWASQLAATPAGEGAGR
ncbi:EAL domain-containing protein [Deinococcus roseus]|uniref:EAL domain-containing protein n=1 Tax=Deinococcus roseus TaxID=392414 RepID=A0ABQ2D5E4_9DEIO|nr:EAL domain-containing protein [Deinococcus roseus]GGJ46797.1 hypothetical protein GCM10008938_36210 [Deinococcus roseus]